MTDTTTPPTTAPEIPALSFRALLCAPHVLLGGTTGSGKSVLLNGIICEALRVPRASLVLIDPKRVELSAYRHSRACWVYAQSPKDAEFALSAACGRMRRTYAIMQRKGLRASPFAHEWIIIDELADLMLAPNARAIRARLQELLQLGRASGVHVIAATQAPNRKTIPAEIVLNFTHRVALRCLSPIESRQIIGQAGAEALPQYGRALFLSPDGIGLYTVPNCTAAEISEALRAAPRRLFRAGAHLRL